MDFDADDHLWVGHIGSRTIHELNADSGKVLATYGPEGGFEGSDDLTVGPDGAVYYTAILTGEVGRINTDGTHSTVANLGVGVNPITFSDDGRLFVGLAFMADGLFEVYPDSATPPRLISATPGINAFDWWDGYLYAPRPDAGEVVRIDVDAPGGDITPVVTGLNYPSAVDISDDGRMYVLAGAPNRSVYEFDPDTGATKVVATSRYGDNMAIDSNGRIFVSGGNDGWIGRALPNGKFVTIARGGVTSASGLAVLPGPRGREVVYSPEKFLLRAFNGRTGQQLLETDGPAMADTAAPDGSRLVMTAQFTNSVSIWNPRTRMIEAYYDDFAYPSNAIRFDGDLIVGELGAGRVTRFDQASGQRTYFEGFAVPTGLAATADDLFAADLYGAGGGTVYQLVRDGVALPVKEVVATGLQGPEGLAVTRDGDLVVVEAGAGRLSLIDLHASPATVTTLVTGLDVGQPGPATMSPIWNFDGVAVGPSGTIYVSANGIFRYELH
jgi:WD40 repeat protein